MFKYLLSSDFCHAVNMQLTSLRQEANQLQRQEDAASAVLAASKAAQKAGQSLSRQEMKSIEATLPGMTPRGPEAGQQSQSTSKEVNLPFSNIRADLISAVQRIKLHLLAVEAARKELCQQAARGSSRRNFQTGNQAKARKGRA